MPGNHHGDDLRVDFFGIGAPKCMTTWMAEVLDEHPGICISAEKQPNFFTPELGLLERYPNPDYLRDWDWYRSMWDRAEPGQLLGDYSTTLIYNEMTSPEVLHDTFPNARYVVQLRDPVKRTHSSWHHHLRAGNPVPRDFETYAWKDEVQHRARYFEMLRAWTRVIPRERFHVVLDLDIYGDPLAAYQGTVAFLGADPTFEPPSLQQRINPPSVKRGAFERLEELVAEAKDAGLGPIVEGVNRLGLGDAVRRLGHRRVEKPSLEPRVEAELREAFLPDVERLEKLIGRDLSPWKPAPGA